MADAQKDALRALAERLRPFLRDYEFAAYEHGKSGENAVEVDAAGERLLHAIYDLASADAVAPEGADDLEAFKQWARVAGINVTTRHGEWLDSYTRHMHKAFMAGRATRPSAAPAAETGSTGAWQPIETAPRDGTQVLVYTNLGNPATAEGVRLAEYAFTENDEEWWQMDDGRYVVRPSHWMPLPDSPTQDAAHGGRG
jgi:hypothetical protein